MEATEIMKTILHFYRTVLPKAYNAPFWNEESVTNAFQYAKFCEKIYQTFVNKPTEKELDELMHSINSHLEENEKIDMCFKDLKKGTAVITQAFLENPNIENNLRQNVLMKIEKDETATYKVINKALGLDLLCFDLIEALKSVKIVNSDRSFYQEVKAELLLDFLKDSTRELASEDQVEKHLSIAFESLCEDDNKMTLLIHVFMHKTAADERIKEIQEFGIHWMLLKILTDKKCSLAIFLWRQTAQKLFAIAVNNMTFCSFYCDFLTKCANSFHCDPEIDASEWKSNLSSSDEIVLSFYDLLNHFRCLLSVDSVCEVTKQHLLDLINSQVDSIVWKEILSRVT